MKIQYTVTRVRDLFMHTAWGIAIHHWLFLLWKNKFRVSWIQIPKVLLITGNAILNGPLQCFEYYRFRKAIWSTEVREPVFIIGHYRSGTTYLHYLMSKDPHFAWCATYEGLTPYTFLSMGGISRAILQALMASTRPQDNVAAGATLPLEEEFAMANMSRTSFVHGYYFPGSIFAAFNENVLFEGPPDILKYWKRALLFFVKKIAFKNGGRQVIMKSPANTGRIKELLSIFPDARFVHLHRNPYDVYSSTVNLYEKILPVLAFHRVTDESMEDFVFYGYEKLYRKFLEEKSLIPADRFMECSYERMVDFPLETLREIYQHFGLDTFDSQKVDFQTEIERLANFQSNSYAPIDDRTKEKIRSRWKFAFEAFDYPL